MYIYISFYIIHHFEHDFPRRSIDKYGGLIRVTFNSFIMMSMARPIRAHLHIFIILFTSKFLTSLRFIS